MQPEFSTWTFCDRSWDKSAKVVPFEAAIGAWEPKEAI